MARLKVLLVAAMTAATAFAAPPLPTAEVVESRGIVSARLPEASAATPLCAGLALPGGTRIQLEPGAHATLVVAGDRPLDLDGPSEYAVPAKAAAESIGLFAGLLARVRAICDSPALPDSAAGRVRGIGPELIYPLGLIAEARPRLRWKGPGPKALYRLTVRSIAGDVVFSGNVRDLGFELPETKLSPGGQYTWAVALGASASPGGGSQGYFEIPPASTLAAVDSEKSRLAARLGPGASEAAKLFLEGVLLECRKLDGGAIAAYHAAAEVARDASLRRLALKAEAALRSKQ